MALKINFNDPLNVSVQEEDILFAVILNNNQAGVNSPVLPTNKPVAVGVIHGVNPGANQIIVDTAGYSSITLTTDHFLFFSKNRRVNTSGLLGYYSLTEFRNGGKKSAEIFATGVEYAPSSK